MERFLNDIADTWKNVICIGSGNEGAVAGHTAGRVLDEEEEEVQEREPALNVQIWKSYVDEMDISIASPSGKRVGPLQEIYISFLPVQSYVDSGVWQIILTPRRIVDGVYQMWLPAQAALNVGTAFLTPDIVGVLTNFIIQGTIDYGSRWII